VESLVVVSRGRVVVTVEMELMILVEVVRCCVGATVLVEVSWGRTTASCSTRLGNGDTTYGLGFGRWHKSCGSFSDLR
jgi:hypothetical protein